MKNPLEDLKQQLVDLSLPDGSHITDAGYVYFFVKCKTTKQVYYCVSCFR